MINKQLKELIMLTKQMYNAYYNYIEDTEPLLVSQSIINFKNQSKKFIELTENLEITNEDRERLNFVLKDLKNNPIPINNIDDFRKQIIDHLNAGYRKGFDEKVLERPDILLNISKKDNNLLNSIIKEKPYLADCKQTLWKGMSPTYNELVKNNSNFEELSHLWEELSLFTNNDFRHRKTLDELDIKIFKYDFFVNTIIQTIAERIESIYSEDLKSAQTEEEKLKIKEKIDKRIAQAAYRIETAKQHSQNLETEKTQGKENEI